MVFKDIEDFKERIDDPALEIDENSVMVLQGAGPKGYPGMPEVGNMPMPKKLLQRGITDLVRVSDARMSGTAYGTVVLHVTPESSAGGTLALVQNGDEIELNVEARKLELCCTGRRAQPQTQSLDAAAARCHRRISTPVHRTRSASGQGSGPRFSGWLPRRGRSQGEPLATRR